MTFLNPLFWTGLFLATLPILIHLLAKRRLKRQPFPYLEFLRRLQTKRMRNLRIRQWLLLLLRTLAVLFLALAFLRPALKSAGAGTTGRVDTVILLDLSASMSMRGAEEMPLVRAKRAISEILQAAGPGGKVSLVVADSSGEHDIDWFTPGATEPAWLQRLDTDGRSTAIRPAWGRVLSQIESVGSDEVELAWISDFCDTPPDTLPTLPKRVKILRIPLASAEPVMNAWFRDVKPLRAIPGPETAIELEVVVASNGGEAPLNAIISTTLDGRRVAESEMSLPPRGETSALIRIHTGKSGRVGGEVQIELEDALPQDNRFPFVLDLPGRKKILLAGDDREAIRYFELALESGPEGGGAFETVRRPGGLRGTDLSKFDVLLLAGISSPGELEKRLIEQFLRAGKGVWILLGKTSDLAAYNRTLLPGLGFGPLLANGGSMQSEWGDLDNDHPALGGLLEGRSRYDKPRVKRVFRAREGNGDRVLVRLKNGVPFIIEREYGGGRVWLTPSAADTSWTDWPISGIFAPLVREGVSYLATGTGRSVPAVVCGEPIYWNVPDQAAAELREVLDPLENLIPAVPAFHAGKRVWRTDATYWPGQYGLLEGDRIVDLAPVRVRESESRLDVTNINNSAWPGRIVTVPEGETLAEILKRLRHGREISGWLLLLALVMLVLESVVAHEKKPAAGGPVKNREAA